MPGFDVDGSFLVEESSDGKYWILTFNNPLSLNVSELTLPVNCKYTLIGTVDGTAVTGTWKSSDETVALVNAQGTVTAKKAGKARITLTLKDSGFSASCTVTVIPLNLRAKMSTKGATLSWDTVQGVSNLRIEWKHSGDDYWTGKYVDYGTSFTDSAIKMGESSTYRLVGSKDNIVLEELTIVFNPFSDVASSGAAFRYVSWAYNNGVVTGTSDTTFTPSGNCTKVQFVMMLWKMHGSPVVGGTNPFSDISGKKTTNAVLWALDKGIINSGSKFNPNSSISRSQIVMILWKLAGSPKAMGTNPFSDITDGSKLCKAVMWAYNNKITTGTSATTFSPDKNCTRQQLVTFLYKYNNIYHVI